MLDRQDEATWERAMQRAWVAPRALFPFLFLSTLGGATLGVVMMPWVTALVEAVNTSLFSPSHPVYAQLSRASGLAAYSLLWLSMLLGLAQSTRLARKWPGPLEAFELHRYVSLLGLSFTLFHAVVLAGDPRVSGRFVLLFLPFGIIQAFPWSWWGQLALYGLLLASLSFYLRRFLGKKLWRTVHGLSMVFYALALVHSIGAGRAEGTMPLLGFYWITGGSVLLFVLYRAGMWLGGRSGGLLILRRAAGEAGRRGRMPGKNAN